jgi:hypothetical protein
MLNTIGAVGYYAATAGYGVKAYRDQRDMRNFNMSKWAGTSTIKSVGSSEYKDRKEAAKKRK